ncbi:DUF6230 family protein [Spirillospora sp. NPDC050679]
MSDAHDADSPGGPPVHPAAGGQAAERVPTVPSEADGILLEGRTRWHRFLAVLTGACLVLAAMVTGVLQGKLPVWAALRGDQYIKVSIAQVTGYGHGAFPQFFQTGDGRSHPVLVAALDDVAVRGVCASSKVRVPFGSVVARLTTSPEGPAIAMRAMQMAIEQVEITDLAGTGVDLNRAAEAADGTPREARPGRLPIDGRNIRFSVHAKIRWVTVRGMKASGMRLSTGMKVKECF